MTAFVIPCTIIKQNGYNLFGEEVTGVRKKEKCAVVNITRNVMHTSLRTDKTASVGAAEELLGEAILLMSPKTIVEIGDTISINNEGSFKVISKRSQYTASSKLDHYEIRCGIGK